MDALKTAIERTGERFLIFGEDHAWTAPTIDTANHEAVIVLDLRAVIDRIEPLAGELQQFTSTEVIHLAGVPSLSTLSCGKSCFRR
jgi:hypothetical protein